MSDREPLLVIDNLAVSLPSPAGRVQVIKRLDLEVDTGEIVGIAGESGSGKSLTALTLLDLLPRGAVVEGSIRFGGQELVGIGPQEWHKVRGSRIAMVFQDSSSALHPMLTVGKQLTEHMRTGLHLNRAQARARALDLLDQMRIPQPHKAMRAYPHQFSGGMRQRIAIAIGLACRPQLLIADEPTTALDVTVQAGILVLLEELRRESDLAVLFITHDLGVLSSVAQRAYVFYAGRAMESGPTGRVLLSPRHPYTAALLGARPHGLSANRSLQAIPGAPALASERLPGCPFEPRCTFAVDTCRTSPPPVRPIGDDRMLACAVDPLLEGVRR
jgi:oligopeptide/dipeptide ABC transporter ATP-binding protein